MQHVIYSMGYKAPSPVGIYPNKEWFFEYKWVGAGVTFVPMSQDALEHGIPEVGDVLWFAMDAPGTFGSVEVLGLVRIQAVDPGLTNALELYYNSDEILDVRSLQIGVPSVTGVVRIPLRVSQMDQLLAKLDPTRSLTEVKR